MVLDGWTRVGNRFDWLYWRELRTRRHDVLTAQKTDFCEDSFLLRGIGQLVSSALRTPRSCGGA